MVHKKATFEGAGCSSVLDVRDAVRRASRLCRLSVVSDSCEPNMRMSVQTALVRADVTTGRLSVNDSH